MKINWKVRIKNKVWLASIAALIVSFVYDSLAMFEIVPSVGEEWVMNVINTVLMLLSMLGVVVDPTTAGIGDSERALEYTEPN